MFSLPGEVEGETTSFNLVLCGILEENHISQIRLDFRKSLVEADVTMEISTKGITFLKPSQDLTKKK